MHLSAVLSSIYFTHALNEHMAIYLSNIHLFYSYQQRTFFVTVFFLSSTELRSDDKRTLCLQLLVLLLPPLHHTALAGLLSLLCIVAQCQESKMDAHNLAVVFAPTLFCNCKTVSFGRRKRTSDQSVITVCAFDVGHSGPDHNSEIGVCSGAPDCTC